MYLEFAVALPKDAEQAFFAEDDIDEQDDGILRIALDGFSELEISRLAHLVLGHYQPILALDGDLPEDIITQIDPAFVSWLAELDPDTQPDLLLQWSAAIRDHNPQAAHPERMQIALDTLIELSRAARTASPRHAVLYAQFIDEMDDIDEA